jgi:uncharacterized protein (UPF0147 family)
MNWFDELELELNRGREAERIGNEGRVRTAARRAVGIAVTEYQRRLEVNRYGADFMRQLRGIAGDQSLPHDVREAATRLQTRISQEFTSPSRQPLADALVIIDFIKRALTS